MRKLKKLPVAVARIWKKDSVPLFLENIERRTKMYLITSSSTIFILPFNTRKKKKAGRFYIYLKKSNCFSQNVWKSKLLQKLTHLSYRSSTHIEQFLVLSSILNFFQVLTQSVSAIHFCTSFNFFLLNSSLKKPRWYRNYIVLAAWNGFRGILQRNYMSL